MEGDAPIIPAESCGDDDDDEEDVDEGSTPVKPGDDVISESDWV